MTAEIHLEVASLEHMTKQPRGQRYALFCQSVRIDPYGIDCVTNRTGGHIGDYEEYADAREVGIEHPHAALIRFYPDFDHTTPSGDFVADFNILPVNQQEL